jgi:hypothetical protein
MYQGQERVDMIITRPRSLCKDQALRRYRQRVQGSAARFGEDGVRGGENSAQYGDGSNTRTAIAWLHEGKRSESSKLTGWQLQTFLIASDASIDAALKPAYICEGICEGGRELGSRFGVQRLGLD